MKEGWEYRKLKECCKELFAGGDVPKPDVSKNKTYHFSVPIYTNGVENEGLYGYTSNARVNEPAVTISARGTIGAIFRRYTPFFPAIRLITAVPQKDLLSVDYLYYSLKTLTVGNSGTSIPQLTIPNIKNIYIPIPPLSEQQSIVDYLDSAFTKIDAMKTNAEKRLNEAKTLFQASLKEMLEPKEGWEENTLKEICKVINGRAYSKDEMLKKGKYRLLRVGNFFTNDSWYYSDLELEEDKYCENGDLLYAWSASFGPRIWDGEKVIYHYHIWKMVCSTKIDKYFLYYWLDSDELKKQTMNNLHGATMAHITKGIIEAAHVRFPSLSEQQTIVATLDSLKSKVDKLQENYDKISQECDALKQAILRQVFE